MNEARGPLRILGVAFAATGALLALQTLVLRAVPYEADLFAPLAAAFRYGFVGADLAVLVALFLLAPRAPRASAFFRVASALVGATLWCGIVGSLPTSREGLAAILAAIEPMTTFGAALLVALGFASMRGPTERIDRRASILTTAAIALTVVVLLFRLYTSLSEHAPSGALSWLRWLFAVAQFIVLAALAFVLAKNATGAKDLGGTPGVTAYREAAENEGPSTKPITPLPPPSPETIAPLGAAIRGLALQRTMVIVRIGAALAAFIVMVGVPEGGVLISAVAGIATSIAIVIALRLQRSLASFRGGAAGILAIVFFVLSGTSELFALAWVFGRGHSALGLGVPLATFLFAAAVVASSRAHERAGEHFAAEGIYVARRARWTQGLVVLFATSALAFIHGVASLRHSYAGGDGVVLFAFVAAVVSMLIATAFHISTLSLARALLRTRLDLATRVGSPPNA